MVKTAGLRGYCVKIALISLASACHTTRGGQSTSRPRSTDGETGGVVPTQPAAASFPVQPTSAMNVVAQIEVGGDWMCIGMGSLWEPSGGKLVRVDPVLHTVITKIEASGNFCNPSPDGSAMWLASVYQGKLYRIDPATNAVTGTYDVKISSGSEGSFAVTESGVWVVTSNGNTSSGTLTRVDPATGLILADITVANDSHGIAAQGGFIWVTSASGNSVTQVDVATNKVVATIAVDKGPRFIAGGEGGVWALCQGTGTVVRIDPVTGKVVATIDTKTPGGGGDIAAGEGGVWVTTFGRPVTRIDPATNKVIAQYQGSGFGDAIRAGAGFVWVSGGRLSQIKADVIAAP